MPLSLNLQFESGISNTKKDRMITMLANKHQTYGTKNAKWVVMEEYKSEENQIYFQTNKSGNKDFVDDMTTLFSEVTEDNKKRLNGKEVATLYFHLGETMDSFSKASRLTRAYQSLLDTTNTLDHFEQVQAEIKNAAETSNKNHYVTLSNRELRQPYLKGGGTLSTEVIYHKCPRCKHNLVDEPPSNKGVEAANEILLVKYNDAVKDYENNGGIRKNRDGKDTKIPPYNPTYEPLLCVCVSATYNAVSIPRMLAMITQLIRRVYVSMRFAHVTVTLDTRYVV